LPQASDFEVYSGANVVTIAVTVEAEDGMPTIVFVPLQKSCIPNLIAALDNVLHRENEGPEEP
jgi:hypothetical protein